MCPGLCVRQDIHSCSTWDSQRPQAGRIQGHIPLVWYNHFLYVRMVEKVRAFLWNISPWRCFGTDCILYIPLYHNVHKYIKNLKKAWSKENFPNVFITIALFFFMLIAYIYWNHNVHNHWPPEISGLYSLRSRVRREIFWHWRVCKYALAATWAGFEVDKFIWKLGIRGHLYLVVGCVNLLDLRILASIYCVFQREPPKRLPKRQFSLGYIILPLCGLRNQFWCFRS